MQYWIATPVALLSVLSLYVNRSELQKLLKPAIIIVLLLNRELIARVFLLSMHITTKHIFFQPFGRSRKEPFNGIQES